MEAAFVDIGLERNGFLHVDESLLPDGPQAPRRGRGQGRRIDELIKPKQEILVQVIKDPIKSKGARLSMNVTIAGRYLVYAPNGSGVGVSRRLADKERERLRRMVGRTYEGPGGLIVRTAAHGAKKTDFVREIAYLHRLGDVLDNRKQGVKAPSLVFQEQDLPVRVLRDVFLNEFDKAVIDDPKQFDRVTSFFQRTAPELVDGVELYEGSKPLFEKWDIERAIQSTLGHRIDLPSGGYLIIDYTEALTVIDVNSGKNVGRGNTQLEDTITRTNLEAATEVVRQLRLRDIGGIIVIDFIDMDNAKNRRAVTQALNDALANDRTRTFVVEISPLGLVQMTRQNISDGAREIMTNHCPTCGGQGFVVSAETHAIDAERQIRMALTGTSESSVAVSVHPEVLGFLTADDGAVLAAIEEDLGLSITLESDASLAPGSARVGGGAAGSGASRSRTRTTRSRSAAKPAGA
jgi:ribonuclease G